MPLSCFGFVLRRESDDRDHIPRSNETPRSASPAHEPLTKSQETLRQQISRQSMSGSEENLIRAIRDSDERSTAQNAADASDDEAKRQLLLQEVMPSAVTLFCLETGKALSQNQSSTAYFATLDLQPGGLINTLFSCQPELLSELYTAVQAGLTWQGVVNMPKALLCGRHNAAEARMQVTGPKPGPPGQTAMRSHQELLNYPKVDTEPELSDTKTDTETIRQSRTSGIRIAPGEEKSHCPVIRNSNCNSEIGEFEVEAQSLHGISFKLMNIDQRQTVESEAPRMTPQLFSVPSVIIKGPTEADRSFNNAGQLMNTKSDLSRRRLWSMLEYSQSSAGSPNSPDTESLKGFNSGGQTALEALLDPRSFQDARRGSRVYKSDLSLSSRQMNIMKKPFDSPCSSDKSGESIQLDSATQGSQASPSANNGSSTSENVLIIQGVKGEEGSCTGTSESQSPSSSSNKARSGSDVVNQQHYNPRIHPDSVNPCLDCQQSEALKSRRPSQSHSLKLLPKILMNAQDIISHESPSPERIFKSSESVCFEFTPDGTKKEPTYQPTYNKSLQILATMALSNGSRQTASRQQSNHFSDQVAFSGQYTSNQPELQDRKMQNGFFHEVTARPAIDPVSKRPAVLITQHDVSAYKQTEAALASLAEAQLNVLSQSFPRHVLEFLSHSSVDNLPAHMGNLARTHQHVTILFMDIAGFTSMSKDVVPGAVLTMLNELFTRFDALADVYGIQKVDTAGDSYIAACGVLEVDGEGFYHAKENSIMNPVESAHRIMAFATDMLLCAREVVMPHNGQAVSIRIGIHTGECVSGLVGTKLPKFSMFGDTMNTASRMESTGQPGTIQVSYVTKELLSVLHHPDAANLPSYEWQLTGGVQIKGKGIMDTYLWRPPEGWEKEMQALIRERPDLILEAVNIGLENQSSMMLSSCGYVSESTQHSEVQNFPSPLCEQDLDNGECGGAAFAAMQKRMSIIRGGKVPAPERAYVSCSGCSDDIQSTQRQSSELSQPRRILSSKRSFDFTRPNSSTTVTRSTNSVSLVKHSPASCSAMYSINEVKDDTLLEPGTSLPTPPPLERNSVPRNFHSKRFCSIIKDRGPTVARPISKSLQILAFTCQLMVKKPYSHPSKLSLDLPRFIYKEF